jgi:DNA-directed RNA polymerase subunit RPC12/RpoP
MAHLHRECGKEVTKIDYINEEAYCPYCEKEVSLKETIADYTFKARTEQLKAMHELMLNANDEEIYMSWIYLMPDEPSEEDFEDIAMDDEQYNECFDLFIELIKDEGNRW